MAMAQHETESLGSSDLDALVFWLLLLLTVAVACLSALWSLSTLQLDHDALDAYDPSVAVDVSQGDFVSIDDALSRSGRHVVFDRLMEVECSVCMEYLGQEEEVRILRPCLHQFHSACIDKWFQGRNATCPLCRTPTSA